jgi:hypothetical protein
MTDRSCILIAFFPCDANHWNSNVLLFRNYHILKTYLYPHPFCISKNSNTDIYLTMGTAKMETQRPAFTSPLCRSFPPKYDSNSSIEEVITTKRTEAREPPNFGFPFPSYPAAPLVKDPTLTPTHLLDIITLTSVDSSSPAKGPTLLTIPLEIRHHIYNYVLVSHPIRHAHLSPNINQTAAKNEEFQSSMLRPQNISFPIPAYCTLRTTFTSSSTPNAPETHPRVISRVHHTRSTKIQGKIPTALLSSCRQIFSETRMLPFHENYFTFVNWLWSGVYAARKFTRGLRPWQSDAMRSTGVEVLGRDLCVNGMLRHGGSGRTGGKGVGEWMELCGLWSGVWGLSLRIKGSVLQRWSGEVDENKGWNGQGSGKLSEEEMADAKERERLRDRSILNVEMEWVIDGLRRMKSLRWIELEIEDEDVERYDKLAFCRALEVTLTQLRNRDDGWQGDVKVVFIERINEEEKDFKWYGGEPGNWIH